MCKVFTCDSKRLRKLWMLARNRDEINNDFWSYFVHNSQDIRYGKKRKWRDKVSFFSHFSWFFLWILCEYVRRKHGKKNGRFSFFEAKYLFRVNDFKINRCYSPTLQLQKYFFKWFRLEHSLIHSVNILEFEHPKKKERKKIKGLE